MSFLSTDQARFELPIFIPQLTKDGATSGATALIAQVWHANTILTIYCGAEVVIQPSTLFSTILQFRKAALPLHTSNRAASNTPSVLSTASCQDHLYYIYSSPDPSLFSPFLPSFTSSSTLSQLDGDTSLLRHICPVLFSLSISISLRLGHKFQNILDSPLHRPCIMSNSTTASLIVIPSCPLNSVPSLQAILPVPCIHRQ